MAKRTKREQFPAPSLGWVKNAAHTDPPKGSAEVLDNFFPTAQGARLRDGKDKHATINGVVRRMLAYRSGSQEAMFACTADSVYDVTTPADADVSPSAAISSLTSGDWVGTQFANASGEYLYMTNGSDAARYYDGSSWTTPTITGATSADLSQCWTYKERLFFIEGGTLSFWYFAVNAISGAATEFPLHGVFHQGGALLFGATWSVDSGSGLNDLCVLVTTEGEVAIYSGADPSDANDWALQGVYRVGKPLDKAGWYKNGGDLMILTEDGIVSVSDAVNKDRSALRSAAASYAIEDAWKEAIANRSADYTFASEVWPTKTMLIVGAPRNVDGLPVAFVANIRTGAWCRYLGWDVGATAIINDQLYFGTPGDTTSVIYAAEKTANDEGTAYSGRWVPKFYEGGAEFKSAIHARIRARSQEQYSYALGCFSDYTIGSYPSATPNTSESPNAWGSGLWGTMVWGGDDGSIRQSEWRTVRGGGASLAPVLVVPSNRTTVNSLELLAMDLLYESGAIL